MKKNSVDVEYDGVNHRLVFGPWWWLLWLRCTTTCKYHTTGLGTRCLLFKEPNLIGPFGDK